MCTFPPGVKATALDRSPAAGAEAPSCALLSIVGLVEVTGIVGCSGRATGDALVVGSALQCKGARGPRRRRHTLPSAPRVHKSTTTTRILSPSGSQQLCFNSPTGRLTPTGLRLILACGSSCCLRPMQLVLVRGGAVRTSIAHAAPFAISRT
eukprot:scaffold128477_cov69-Phaeocystis_antarctica.AAC.3